MHTVECDSYIVLGSSASSPSSRWKLAALGRTSTARPPSPLEFDTCEKRPPGASHELNAYVSARGWAEGGLRSWPLSTHHILQTTRKGAFSLCTYASPTDVLGGCIPVRGGHLSSAAPRCLSLIARPEITLYGHCLPD